jgi:hypothetical protein
MGRDHSACRTDPVYAPAGAGNRKDNGAGDITHQPEGLNPAPNCLRSVMAAACGPSRQPTNAVDRHDEALPKSGPILHGGKVVVPILPRIPHIFSTFSI